MNKIGIFVNRERDTGLKSARLTAKAFLDRGKSVLVDEAYKNEFEVEGVSYVDIHRMPQMADLIVALGGDGTILKIIGDAAKVKTPVIGINLGHLGFLTQAERDDAEIFDKIVNEEFTVNEFMMLEAKVFKNGKSVSCALALNDIIFRGSNSKMISLETEVDGTVTNRYLADGIIVATSTGSTAYSLSCGGPIVHQGLDCIILTPVSPHTLKSRCIVIPPESKVVLRFDSSYCSETELKIDGNFLGNLTGNDYIEIARSEVRAPLALLNERNYFDVIREKLSD